MRREHVATIDGIDVIALDSASQIDTSDRGHIVVTGSNAGKESGRAAIAAGCAAIVMNDAGIGKDRAGVAGLDIVEPYDMPAMAVSYDTAEISDGLSTWNEGRISTVNGAATRHGIEAGMTVPDAIRMLIDSWRSAP